MSRDSTLYQDLDIPPRHCSFHEPDTLYRHAPSFRVAAAVLLISTFRQHAHCASQYAYRTDLHGVACPPPSRRHHGCSDAFRCRAILLSPDARPIHVLRHLPAMLAHIRLVEATASPGPCNASLRLCALRQRAIIERGGLLSGHYSTARVGERLAMPFRGCRHNSDIADIRCLFVITQDALRFEMQHLRSPLRGVAVIFTGRFIADKRRRDCRERCAREMHHRHIATVPSR